MFLTANYNRNVIVIGEGKHGSDMYDDITV